MACLLLVPGTNLLARLTGKTGSQALVWLGKCFKNWGQKMAVENWYVFEFLNYFDIWLLFEL